MGKQLSTVFTGALIAVSMFALSACGNTGTTAPAASGTASAGTVQPATGQIVITYNTPAQWGNYDEVLQSFTAKTGIQAPNDPKNSGQTLTALQAEKDSPVADVAYTGIAFAPQLTNAELLEAYQPAGSSQIDANLKSADGFWHSVHYGSIAFIVNKDHLDGAPVPESWNDLLKPEYKGKFGFLDPTQAAVGYSVATAANEAMGGTLDNWAPGLDYLKKLKDNGAIISAQTATAKVAQGEIPILIDTDFNGYQLRDSGTNVAIVIPQEGSLKVPYIVGLVKGAPHADNGKKLLDFYFSEEGQQLFAKGYMRPVIGEVPPEVAAKTLPASDYERVKSIDYLKQGAVQADFIKLYKESVS